MLDVRATHAGDVDAAVGRAVDVVTVAQGVDHGGREVEACRCGRIVEALPTNAVRIELIWDHPEADLDLHLVRAGGTFCDCANDVHYRDCGRRPDWFPVTPGANPRLDVDDRSGFGPENINIDGEGPERFIPDGRYAILVHYYSANAGVSTWPTKTAEATVRVYLYGLLAAELKQPLALDGDLWTAGTLNWPERTITPSQSVLGAQTCAMF